MSSTCVGSGVRTQDIANRVGGSQPSTVPHSTVVPSAHVSYTRPPRRGSTVTSRVRCRPAEIGFVGHHAPIARTNVSNVCARSLRTSADCRTGGGGVRTTDARGS